MNNFWFCLGIYVVATLAIVPLWVELTPKKFDDFTILQTILIIPLIPAILLYKLGSKTVPFFTSKPFKKARFTVGEEVMFGNVKALIVKNEKDCEGENVVIRVPSSYGGTYDMTVATSKIKRLTKLEQALK